MISAAYVYRVVVPGEEHIVCSAEVRFRVDDDCGACQVLAASLDDPSSCGDDNLFARGVVVSTDPLFGSLLAEEQPEGEESDDYRKFLRMRASVAKLKEAGWDHVSDPSDDVLAPLSHLQPVHDVELSTRLSQQPQSGLRFGIPTGFPELWEEDCEVYMELQWTREVDEYPRPWPRTFLPPRRCSPSDPFMPIVRLAMDKISEEAHGGAALVAEALAPFFVERRVCSVQKVPSAWRFFLDECLASLQDLFNIREFGEVRRARRALVAHTVLAYFPNLNAFFATDHPSAMVRAMAKAGCGDLVFAGAKQYNSVLVVFDVAQPDDAYSADASDNERRSGGDSSGSDVASSSSADVFGAGPGAGSELGGGWGGGEGVAGGGEGVAGGEGLGAAGEVGLDAVTNHLSPAAIACYGPWDGLEWVPLVPSGVATPPSSLGAETPSTTGVANQCTHVLPGRGRQCKKRTKDSSGLCFWHRPSSLL